MLIRSWSVACALGALCVSALPMANAQETPHKITAQEVAEALADPSATINYGNLNFRHYQDVGPRDDANQELRLNAAGFLKPGQATVLYRGFLPMYSTDFPVDDTGVGDALLSAYVVPKGGTLILGYGGALMLPTASEDYFGTGKWSAGPTLVAAKKVPGRYTVGGLLTHMWSFAGDDDRAAVSMTTIQPAISLFLNRRGTSLTVGSETTYNWEADVDEWQVPLTAGLNQILPPFGKFFVGIGLAGTYYIEKPEYAQEWDMRVVASIVLP